MDSNDKAGAIVMSSLIGALVVVIIIVYKNNCRQTSVIDIAEKAYFEGQKDALEGDIRIARDSCGNWQQSKDYWE